MRNAFETLRLLKPYDIDRVKVRIGAERDGGYILADLDRFSHGDVLSFGVGPDVTFEHALACKGRRVFLHDHTVAAMPQQHERFTFSRRGICGAGRSTAELVPLSEHVAAIGDLSGQSILKMDVEGYEWETFASVQPQQLDCFDQIVVEVHWLTSLLKEPNTARSLKTLNNDFTLFHVHANNYAGMAFVDGMPVPDVLELSYVRTSLVERSASQTVYPTTFDRANNPGATDHPLFYFPFFPSAPAFLTFEQAIDRISADAKSDVFSLGMNSSLDSGQSPTGVGGRDEA